MVNMWMVRAGKNAMFIDDFERLNVVAVGWGLGDLTNKTSDEIKELVYKHYPDNSNKSNGKIAANEIKFRHKLNVGDYVLSYNNWTHNYLFGKITSDYYYDPLLINDEFSDVRDVEWLCKIPKDSLKKTTQNSLGALLTIFKIEGNAKKDILSFYQEDNIKQIRTVTLSNTNSDTLTYDDAINFLSNVLINEREGHYHYIRKNIDLIGRTLVLFKYEGKLIAKGIFCDEFEKQVVINNEQYNGYYLTEKDSISIFKESIGLNELKKYIPNVKSLNRDQIIDLKYLDNINQMIDYYIGESMINEYDKSAKIIRDYLDENNLGNIENEEYEQAYIKFKDDFAPEILENLTDIDILNTIFIHDGDKNTLCSQLEFSDDYKFAGSISGGSAHKYSLFKHSKTQQWTAGAAKNSKNVNESEAIEIAKKIRDAIVNGAHLIEQSELSDVNDYIQLENELGEIFSNCSASHTNMWIHKYYALIFPEKFPVVHWDKMKKEFLQTFNIVPEDWYYALDGQLVLLTKKAGVKGYSLFKDEILDLFKSNKSPFESDFKRNLIYFGAPGTGKSYNLNEDKNDLLENYENNYERVTFHPDYSYANFVGTYKPVPENGSITYKYVPGPFMRILKKALNNPNKPYLLIIEEINRANVAAVFGDVFQLLDRNEENISDYDIATSEDMKSFIAKDKIVLPQNLFIWATMNSADQGVFPMDTAFKRRWNFKYFSINNNEELIENTHTTVNGKEVNWNTLRKQINDELLSYKINEDKLMGPFFAFNEFMNQEIPEETFKDIFKNKIIMYLFEDAARAKRNDLFSGAKTKDYVTYSEICEAFDKIGLKIFNFISDDE